MYRLVIAEKPSVAMGIAQVLGAAARKEGHMEGSGWLVSWCVGHLAELAEPAAYNPDYAKWRREDLPILPESWRFTIGQDKREQFDVLRTLLRREDVSEVVNACDAGREGELIFRTAYHLAGCSKPVKRLWISSMEDSAIREGFTGLVYCADCGFKIRNQVERFTYKDGRPGRYSSFVCGSYSCSGENACTIHTIYEDALKQLVLADIREKAQYAEYDRERLLAQIIRMKDKELHSRAASYEQELKTISARVSELERLMQNLYEDKCTGVVPQTVFQTLMKKYETERAQKAAALPELERKVRAQVEHRHDADRWAEIIRRYTEIMELDETILFGLVDRIGVGEARKVGKTRIQDVKVFYRYVGCVDGAMPQERREAV